MRIFNFLRKATVIIPVYKSSLSHFEQISLTQCCKILGSHTITLIKPHSLSIELYTAYHANFIIEPFDDNYFKDIDGYNRLMLSAAFYERFLKYEYILIHQLDAFVFKDKLQYWCRKDYDYIGAPWLTNPFEGSDVERKIYLEELDRVYKHNIKHEESIVPVDSQFYNRVGNGGFSLRRVKKFYKICIEEKQLIAFYNQHTEHHFFNEDVFWSLEVNRQVMKLKIPDYKKAVFFSIEFKPEYAFVLTEGKLPFACHAWDLFLDFWRNKLKEFGYTV